MEKPKRIKIKIGDIFAVPLAPNKTGYGQIIAGERIIYYMAGFDHTTGLDEVPQMEA
jgi:hypothetical protein